MLVGEMTCRAAARISTWKNKDAPGIRRLLVLSLFSFQCPFFLLSMLSLFLVFLFAFVFFSLIAHICFSVIENEMRFGRISILLSFCVQDHQPGFARSDVNSRFIYLDSGNASGHFVRADFTG